MNESVFAPGKDMLRAEAALAELLAAVAPVEGRESVPLPEAAGRVLAEPLIAARDVPPHDNAAVDGYAVRADDLAADGGTVLPVAGRIAAGQVFAGEFAPGTALRVFTGAALPPGPDLVVPQEICREAEGRVTLGRGKRGQNLRRRAEDMSAGTTFLAAGTRLRPQEVGLAASQGLAKLSVYRRPRAVLFSSGDELREPGAEAGPAAIYDSNRYVLIGLARGAGAEVVDRGILPDNEARLRASLAEAAEGADLLLTSGGASAGDEDHVKPAVRALGELRFWKIAIRPGRPLVFGHIGKTPLLGLPGNPVASMLCFLIFARPLLLRLAGAAQVAPQYYPVIADFPFAKRVGRREWVRATVHRDAEGNLRARRFPREGSGILTSMAVSSGLVELPEDMAEVKQGDRVDYLPFAEVLG